jgi:hypothetical protein
MTNLIQVCSNFHSARAFILRTRPDEVSQSHPRHSEPVLIQEGLRFEGSGSGVRGQESGVRGQGSGVRGRGSGVGGQGSGFRGEG